MSSQARVCLFSQRHLLRDFFRSANYEFEDVIDTCDDVDLITPEPRGNETAAQRWRNRFAYRLPSVRFDPGIKPVNIERTYDLFLTTCEFVDDLYTFDAVEHWRERSRISACYLTELWAQAIPKYRRLLRTLSKFDIIFVNCAASVEPLSEAIGRPCHYLLPGIDALRFCPYPALPPRVIDVYSMGRRDPQLHQELLRLRKEQGLFYLHDSNDAHSRQTWNAANHREHRMLTADLIQRSRYFVVNPAKMDCQAETAGQQEIGYRFFEGAAGGAVMIGQPVANARFYKSFDWTDAVIAMPNDSRDLGEFLFQLNRQPRRLEAARRHNVRESLLRHDWVYRWEQMLQQLDLAPSPKLEARKQQLRARARAIEPITLEASAAA